MNILIYQIGSLGDTLVSLPAYQAIRRHFGTSAHIQVVHNRPADARAVPQQVLAGSGLIDGSVSFTQTGGRSSWWDTFKLWLRLLPMRADTVVYLAPAARGAGAVKRDQVFFRLCGIPKTLGFHACEPSLFTAREENGRPKPIPHEAVLRLGRLRKDGIDVAQELALKTPLLTIPAAEIETVRTQILQGRVAAERSLAAIAPGANQPANFWPLSRFIEIGRRLIEQKGLEPVVIGGPAEREAGEKMVAAWGRGINAAGRLSVVGSAALLSQCQFLVGLDTGTTHLAASVGTPCVTLHGERNPPGQWSPLGVNHIVLRHEVPCAGCGLRVCPKPDHPCMMNITVDQAWAAILMVVATPKVISDDHAAHIGGVIDRYENPPPY